MAATGLYTSGAFLAACLIVLLTALPIFEGRTNVLYLCPGQEMRFHCSTNRDNLHYIFLIQENIFVASVILPGEPKVYPESSLGRHLQGPDEFLTFSNKTLEVRIPYREEFKGTYFCKMKFTEKRCDSYDSADIVRGYVTVHSAPPESCASSPGVSATTSQTGTTTPVITPSRVTTPSIDLQNSSDAVLASEPNSATASKTSRGNSARRSTLIYPVIVLAVVINVVINVVIS